jgi:iron complex transport system ATP-binding protein
VTVPLLSASAVSHAWGHVPVLRNVDLALEPGEVLAVLGPNGAGKTTLLRVLSGVLRALDGEVRVRERALARLGRREVARSLAVVPQEIAVPFPFRVRDIVAMGRAPHLGPFGREGPHDHEAVERALLAQGLLELAERVFPTLSGGEKQRVMLARALAQETDALLLDEPTAHMDLGHRVHTLEWLRAWVAQAPALRGVLLITHDLVLGARFADRVLLLDRGRVVAEGAAVDVLTPQRIAEVYGVEAEVTRDAHGRPLIVASRSRIRYTAGPDEPDRRSSSA